MNICESTFTLLLFIPVEYESQCVKYLMNLLMIQYLSFLIFVEEHVEFQCEFCPARFIQICTGL